MARSTKCAIRNAAILLAVTLLLVIQGSTVPAHASNRSDSEIVVGAYYLTGWGLYNNQKSSDWRIVAPFTPEFGGYNSSDPAAAGTHIDWALSHGVNFFIMPFTHAGYGWENALENGFLKSQNVGRIKFAIMTNYEPYWSDSPGFPNNNEERVKWMLGDIEYIVDHYTTHPSYLKVGDRPVVFVYHASSSLSDSLGGIQELSQFVSDVRATARQKGIELYLVGDVMYWLPLSTDKSFARLFDAVSAYTLPDAGVGWVSDNGRLKSVGPYAAMVSSYAEMMKHWSELSRSLGVGFIPPVTPGFNNTGTFNAGIDNFLVVRTGSSPDKFAQMIRIAVSYADTSLKMMVVEAWNEYHEGSVVEPTSQFGFSYLDAIAQSSAIPGVSSPSLESFAAILQSGSGSVTRPNRWLCLRS
jgi:hypothetical protein